MNLEPLGDRLIVEVLEEEEQTMSGIVLPDHREGEAAARQGSRRRSGRRQQRQPQRFRTKSSTAARARKREFRRHRRPGRLGAVAQSNTGSTRTTRALGPRHRVEKALSDHPGGLP
jgi:hypothetical protein